LFSDVSFKTFCFSFEFKHNGMSSVRLYPIVVVATTRLAVLTLSVSGGFL